MEQLHVFIESETITLKQLEEYLQNDDVKRSLFTHNLNEEPIRNGIESEYEFIPLFKGQPNFSDIRGEFYFAENGGTCDGCGRQLEIPETVYLTLSTANVNTLAICRQCLDNVCNKYVLTKERLEGVLAEGDKHIKQLRRQVKKKIDDGSLPKKQIERIMNNVYNPCARTEGVLQKRKTSECLNCSTEIEKGDTCVVRKNSKFNFKSKRTVSRSETVCIACLKNDIRTTLTNADILLNE